MMLTEDEARKKWCPMARYVADSNDPNTANRWVRISTCCCIASDCMAWRWEPWVNGSPANGPRNNNGEQRDPRGYCGAFGKPGDAP